MRLLAKVRGLEAVAVAGARARRQPTGVVWTSDDVRVDPEAVGAGEHVALDVRITGAIGETPTWQTVERVSREASDLGVVYDAGGSAVGRVVRVDGSLVEWAVSDSAAG